MNSKVLRASDVRNQMKMSGQLHALTALLPEK
jgi:hypothetical protein